MNIQILAPIIAALLLAENCSALGLLGGLGSYGNPWMGDLGGCGCGCSPSLYGYGSLLPCSRLPALGLGCPTTCCLCLAKPSCLLTKLLLKKKLIDKKLSLLGCGCGCGCGCAGGGLGYGLL